MTTRFRPSIVLFALAVASCTAACGRANLSAAPNDRGNGGGGRGRGGGGDGGAVPVTTAVAARRDVPVEVAAIGNVEAYESVSVRSQITGTVTGVHFREGDFVKKGDELFTIDARPYEALLEQARANLTRDGALLAQAEAQLSRDRSQSDYVLLTSHRNEELAERGIVSKDLAQQSEAQSAASAAAVRADEAAIASAKAQIGAQQAAVDNAGLQLAYTVIRSPINGRTGTLMMKPGNLVAANTTELTTIAQIEPVYVSFAVPAAKLDTIREQQAKQRLSVSIAPQNEEAAEAPGILAFVDNNVDPATDTIRLKAQLDNRDHRLWPGEFARVSLRLTTLTGATVVSSEAVQTGQDGPFIFVVKPDSTVEQRRVTIAQRVNDDVVIGEGLQPGETIVTEGQLRLEPGSRIAPPGSGGDGGGRGGRGGRGGQRGGGRTAS